MNILFVTFGNLSVGEGAIRSVSILRALADAGYHVDVIAAKADLGAHPNIDILVGDGSRLVSRQRLKMAILRAMGGKSYHIVHAVDDAIIHVARIGKLKRTKIVYEACRCFSGSNGIAPSRFWKFFPARLRRVEEKVLTRSAIVLTACNTLSTDLNKLVEQVHIVQVEDIPVQSLFPRNDIERKNYLGSRFDGRAGFVVSCSILPDNQNELRTLLLAARKVIEKIPQAGFFFKGVPVDEAQAMASNLDIQSRCVFFPANEPEEFLAALGISDAALFVPRPGRQYMHPEILTLLNSPALVVAVQDGAYAALLSERNSVQVDFTASSIAEGLLRVLEEPLLSFGLVAEAQKMIADHYSFSSFKHKIRMAYHELTKVA